jgi:hypothetical protein
MEMRDLPLPELNSTEHIARVQEMIDRPARPPPFPNKLPGRPPNKLASRWAWLSLALGVLAFLLAAGIIVLTVFFVKEKAATGTLQISRAELVSSLSSLTATTVMTTLTSHHTLTATATSTKYDTTKVTIVSINTNIVAPSLTPPCDVTKAPLFLGTNYCTMVNKCNATTADIEKNDCKGFCSLNPTCKQQWDDKSDHTLNMKPQLIGCCGFCKCFKKTGPNDIMSWPTKPGLKPRTVSRQEPKIGFSEP